MLSVLLPSMHRYNLLKQCVESLIETTRNYEVELIVSIDEDEDSHNLMMDFSQTAPENFHIKGNFYSYKRGALKAWNDALKMSNKNYKFLLPSGDDQLFHAGWLDYALDAHSRLGGYGCVGLDDMNLPVDHPVSTTLFFDRKFCIEVFNGNIIIPKYNYLWVDVELCERAKAVGKFIKEPRSRVEHIHSSNGKRRFDDIDKQKVEKNYHEIDGEIFERRKTQGFPNDFEMVITE